MPYEFDKDEDNARILLQSFIIQTKQLLENIIRNEVVGYDFKSKFGEDIYYLKTAYDDAMNKNVFQKAYNLIENTETIEGFDIVLLTGDSLKAKLGLLQSFANQFLDGIRKAIKYLLRLVNSILGSIKAALGPAGTVFDAIKELKDMVEAKVELVDDLGGLMQP